MSINELLFPQTNLNETVDALLLPLLLEQLEEDDVEERARGQPLQRDHLGALHLLLPRHRLRQRDPDGDPDRREQGERALKRARIWDRLIWSLISVKQCGKVDFKDTWAVSPYSDCTDASRSFSQEVIPSLFPRKLVRSSLMEGVLRAQLSTAGSLETKSLLANSQFQNERRASTTLLYFTRNKGAWRFNNRCTVKDVYSINPLFWNISNISNKSGKYLAAL